MTGMLKLTSDEGVDIKYHYYEAASPANFVDFIIAPRTRDVYLAEKPRPSPPSRLLTFL